MSGEINKMRERIEITQAPVLPLYNLCTIIVYIKPTKYVMRNAGLEVAQAGIKIAGRNINNLRYAYDTTLIAEIKEELKNLLMKVKEESEKVG